MKEHPILFSAPMIRALLEGRKTMTRRVIREVPTYTHFKYLSGPKEGQPKPIMDWDLSGVWQEDDGTFWLDVQTDVDDNSHTELHCPYGQPGDRLIVREAVWLWCERQPNGKTKTGRTKWHYVWQENTPPVYVADHPEKPVDDIPVTNSRGNRLMWKYKSARFMPKKASRITLEITDVQVQQVQDISEADADAEGTGQWAMESNAVLTCETMKDAFHALWDSINAERGLGWDANPWIWALRFKTVKP